MGKPSNTIVPATAMTKQFLRDALDELNSELKDRNVIMREDNFTSLVGSIIRAKAQIQATAIINQNLALIDENINAIWRDGIKINTDDEDLRNHEEEG